MRASADVNWAEQRRRGGIVILSVLDRAVMYYIARTEKLHITSGNNGLRCECDFGATDP
jgi:hypothetical protein